MLSNAGWRAKYKTPNTTWEMKYKILCFDHDDLTSYYETDALVASKIRTAHNAIKANGQWSCLICPIDKCQIRFVEASRLLSHLCNKHKDIPFGKL